MVGGETGGRASPDRCVPDRDVPDGGAAIGLVWLAFAASVQWSTDWQKLVIASVRDSKEPAIRGSSNPADCMSENSTVCSSAPSTSDGKSATLTRVISVRFSQLITVPFCGSLSSAVAYSFLSWSLGIMSRFLRLEA